MSDLPLFVTLAAPDGQQALGVPLVGDDAGILVALPWSEAFALAEGDEVAVTLEGAQGAFRAPGLVAAVDAPDDAVEVRLHWADPERVRLRLPGGLRAAMEDVSLRCGQPAVVRTRQPDGTWVGVLRDLTPHGACLGLPRSGAPAEGEGLSLRLELPVGAPPVAVRGQVVSVRPATDGVWVDLEFAGPEPVRRRVADAVTGWLQGQRDRRGALAS